MDFGTWKSWGHARANDETKDKIVQGVHMSKKTAPVLLEECSVIARQPKETRWILKWNPLVGAEAAWLGPDLTVSSASVNMTYQTHKTGRRAGWANALHLAT